MTVRELISELKKQPQDALIKVIVDYRDSDEIEIRYSEADSGVDWFKNEEVEIVGKW